MRVVDSLVACVFLVGMLGAGLWFGRRQHADHYFVGGRKLGWGHLGLSIAATDVGGGFSIGLGGLGFAMGLSASWLLFTGLVGAWIAAIVVVPRVKSAADANGWQSYADFVRARCGSKPAATAAMVSAVGYTAFVGAQILAGAKLASVAFGFDLNAAIAILAIVVVVYTSAGGLDAVVYTDTVQWIIVVVGLTLALPLAIDQSGGWSGLRAALPAGHLSVTSVSGTEALVWLVSIVPIWFVAMTLYQRIYAARDEASARRAFLMAGLFEYPVIAFLGAAVGTCGRALFPEAESETAIPLLLRDVLPTGMSGLVLSAYFAAILSTADSCLLAATGHVTVDFFTRAKPEASSASRLRVARIASVILGLGSVAIASAFPKVLEIMLGTYGLMVSSLFAPTLFALFWPLPSRVALASMFTGAGAFLAATNFNQIAPLSEPMLLALPVSFGVVAVFGGKSLLSE